MASQQTGAWQSGRPRPSNSSSRTPQNRSGTASPNQQNPSQPPRQEAPRTQPPNNVWAQRGSNATGANGGLKMTDATQEPSVNGFNAVEVNAFLSRDVGAAAYKPMEGSGSARTSGSAWGAKPSHMANNSPFFTHLAKQTATLEGGG